MHVNDGIALNHLDHMTDSTGLVQHAIYSIPRRESGYTTDDNARALRLCVRLWDQHPEERMLKRVTTYLSFLEFARGIGRGFHNFLSYDRRWLDAEGCGDCQGQSVRALAEVLGSSLPGGYRALARELIDAVLPTLADLRSLRAQSYVILAWGHLRSVGVEDLEPLETVAWSAARRLAECYHRAVRPDWQWFESRMTYANAVLPHALFVAARHWPQEDFLDIAQASFAFLDQQTTVEGVFWPVGNEGWYARGEEKASYDQQPVEAVTMAETAQAAFDLLGDELYLATFDRARAWFHGHNSLNRPLVDVRSGACYDGLQAAGVNHNQGAESTLAYLWTEMSSAKGFDMLNYIDGIKKP
ncbi:MAG: glycosyltransferase [Planctomycetota bacterium]